MQEQLEKGQQGTKGEHQEMEIKLEQDAWFDGEDVQYIGGRQTTWHIVR